MQRALRIPNGACHAASRSRLFGGSRLLMQVHSSSSSQPVLVDGLVVQPAYRSTPWDAEEKIGSKTRDKALVMFVSESGICRAPLAAAAFKQLLSSSPLRDWIEVQARATRDYCAGQEPHPTALAAAAALAAPISAQAASQQQQNSDAAAAAAAGGAVVFDPAHDIVAADLVLVMDKYTAADVLREVSSYDLINPGGYYSARVRLLGSFHPQLAAQAQQTDGQDIDDPLYGNVGGEQEQAAVVFVAQLINESCGYLLQQLEGLAAANNLLPQLELGASTSTSSSSSSGDCSSSEGSAGAAFRDVLVQHVREEGVISWMVPPMLQGSNTDLGGWV